MAHSPLEGGRDIHQSTCCLEGWVKCIIEVESAGGGRGGFRCEREEEKDLVKVGREAVGGVLSGGTERAKAQRQGAWGLNSITKEKDGQG